MLGSESSCVFPVAMDLLVTVWSLLAPLCRELLGQWVPPGWVTPGWPCQCWGSPIAQGAWLCE